MLARGMGAGGWLGSFGPHLRLLSAGQNIALYNIHPRCVNLRAGIKNAQHFLRIWLENPRKIFSIF
jgi:hypothetical protein